MFHVHRILSTFSKVTVGLPFSVDLYNNERLNAELEAEDFVEY